MKIDINTLKILGNYSKLYIDDPELKEHIELLLDFLVDFKNMEKTCLHFPPLISPSFEHLERLCKMREDIEIAPHKNPKDFLAPKTFE